MNDTQDVIVERLTVFLTAKEKRQIKLQALLHDMGMSEYVRDIILEKLATYEVEKTIGK